MPSSIVFLIASLVVAWFTGTTRVAPAPERLDRRFLPGFQWQWQLEGVFDRSAAPAATIFDLDLFEVDRATIRDLQYRGMSVICSVSVGTWEEWRPDASEFPASVLGRAYPEWPGERWLDVRRIDLLAPILERRFALAKAKMCDAIEPDNVDGYTNDTGFPITADDQLRFTRWVADTANRMMLSVGLKNDPDHAVLLEPYFDWALTEDCAAEGWCDKVRVFLDHGKAVLQAEYTDTDVDFAEVCRTWGVLGYSPILKRRSLDAWRRSCPARDRL